MFQFTGFPSIRYGLAYGWLEFFQPGFPIQISADRWIFAPPRSFSQLITSFVGSWCQGILPTLLLAWSFWSGFLSSFWVLFYSFLSRSKIEFLAIPWLSSWIRKISSQCFHCGCLVFLRVLLNSQFTAQFASIWIFRFSCVELFLVYVQFSRFSRLGFPSRWVHWKPNSITS